MLQILLYQIRRNTYLLIYEINLINSEDDDLKDNNLKQSDCGIDVFKKRIPSNLLFLIKITRNRCTCDFKNQNSDINCNDFLV